MDRLEKVIKGLEFCTTYPCYCTGCPYDEICELDADELMRDALFLLKSQEPIEPKQDSFLNWRCGNCNMEIDKYGDIQYCPRCGKAVEWK